MADTPAEHDFAVSWSEPRRGAARGSRRWVPRLATLTTATPPPTRLFPTLQAEDTRVTIIPNFAHIKFDFISGECGPFEPGLPVEVPLWLALTLKRQLKCQVTTPKWLEIDELRSAIDAERESTGFGDKVPYHYLEIASMLLNGAKEDIANQDAIRTAIEDLKDIRQGKIRSGIRAIVNTEFGSKADGDVTQQVDGIGIRMRGIAAMEIHAMRDHFLLALERMQTMAAGENVLYKDESASSSGGGGGGGDLHLLLLRPSRLPHLIVEPYLSISILGTRVICLWLYVTLDGNGS